MIALLGTGLLGSGFAERLLALGRPLRVWNRDAAKTAPLRARGAEVAASPAEAVRGCDRVHLVLSEDGAVEAVLDQALAALPAGAWLIDHSTTAPEPTAARFARLRAQGVRYVHAPVFMAPEHARAGTGLMLLSAPDDELPALQAALGELTGKLWHLGPRPDAAALHKLMGNAMLFLLSGAMGELFALARAQGMAEGEVLRLFEQFRAGAGLPMLGQRVLEAAEREPTFTLAMARKDLRLALEAAGPGLELLPALARSMDHAIDEGLGARDYAIFAGRAGRRG